MLRKAKNKERLMPVKGDNGGTKRRKIDNNKYITIQENWGPPPTTTASKKNLESPERDQEPVNKKQRTTEQQRPERINNIITLEKKVNEGPIECGLEWEEPRDWDKVLREHKERIEMEEQEQEQVRKAKKKDRKLELIQPMQAVLRKQHNIMETTQRTPT